MDKKTITLFLKFSYGIAISSIISFLTTMITTRMFSPTEFGISAIYTNIVLFISVFLMLGTDQTLVRYFNEEDSDKRPALLRKTISIPLVCFIIFLIVTLFFIEKLSTYMFGIYNSGLMIIFYVSILAEITFRYAILYIRMNKKAHLYSIIQILNKVIVLISMVLVYYLLGNTYKEIIISMGIGIIITTITTIFLDKNTWFSISKKESAYSYKTIFNYSIPFMITMVLTILVESIDKHFIKLFAGDYQVGIYSAAFKIVSVVALFQGMITTFLLPIYFEHYKTKPEDTSFYTQMNVIVSILMIAIGMGVIAFKEIIIKLLSPDYIESVKVIPFLTFYPVLYTISETTVIGINFKKKTSYHLIVSFSILTTSLLSNYFLVSKYGAIGASFATAIVFIVFLITRTFLSVRIYNVNYNIIRMFFSILIYIVYAYLSVFYLEGKINIIIGLILGIIIIIIYLIPLIDIYKFNKKSSNKRSDLL